MPATSPTPRSSRLLPTCIAATLGCALGLAVLATRRWLIPIVGPGDMTSLAPVSLASMALALGFVFGGRLADRGRRNTMPLTWVALLFASVWMWAGYFLWPELLTESIPPTLHAVAYAALWLLPVCFLLGTLTVLLIKETLSRHRFAGHALAWPCIGLCVGLACAPLLFRYGVVLLLEAPFYTAAIAGVSVVGALLTLRIEDRGDMVRTRRHEGRWQSVGRVWPWTAFAMAMIATSFLVVARVRAARFVYDIDIAEHIVPITALMAAVGIWIARKRVDRALARPAAAALFVLLGLAVVVPLWWPLERSSALRTPWLTGLSLVAPCAVVLGALLVIVIRAPLEDASADGHHVGRSLAMTALGVGAGVLFANLLPGYLGTHGPLRIALAFCAISAAAWVLLAGQGIRLLIPIIAAIALAGAVAYQPPITTSSWRSRRGDLHAGPTTTAMIEVESLSTFDALRTHPKLSEKLGFLRSPPRISWRGPMSRTQELELRRAISQPKGRKAVEALLGRVGRSLRVLSDAGRERAVVDLHDPTWTSGDLDAFVMGLGIKGLIDAKKDNVLIASDGYSPIVWPVAARSPARGTTTVLVTESAFYEAFLRAIDWPAAPTFALRQQDMRPYLRHHETHARFGWIHIDTRAGRTVRWHTMTTEAVEQLHASLCDGGFVSLVLHDAPRSRTVLSPVVASLSTAFSHIQIYALRRRHDTSPRERNTPTHNRVVPMVIYAGNRPVDVGRVEDEAGRPIRFTEFGQLYMEALRQQAGGRVLSDAFAPIDASPPVDADTASNE